MAQLNFETILPAVAITKTNGYAVIPAFDYLAPVWNGASQIVTQFNYSADKNFVLRETPIKPHPYPLPNYVPVIRYRIGAVATRYKLWAFADEILQEVPYYKGQVIKKNFVIEIWSAQNQERVTNLVDWNLYLSIRRTPVDMSNPINFKDPTSQIEVLQPALSFPGTFPIDFSSADVEWLDNPHNPLNPFD